MSFLLDVILLGIGLASMSFAGVNVINLTVLLFLMTVHNKCRYILLHAVAKKKKIYIYIFLLYRLNLYCIFFK